MLRGFSSRNNTINLYDNSVIKADQTFNITNTEFRPVVSSSGNEGTTTLSGAGGGNLRSRKSLFPEASLVLELYRYQTLLSMGMSMRVTALRSRTHQSLVI